jgi:S-adenosylmethionine-diacylgycerolhomoserine-N-methlytransferase
MSPSPHAESTAESSPSDPADGASSKAHAGQMDRIYRYTRHVYDASRKYYLVGRDGLIDRMELRPGDRVLEMGCGTARNLIKLHRRAPEHALFGNDASSAMLETAAGSVARAGAEQKITLRPALAEDVDYRETFGLDEPFDVVFFSYALSMMPTWPQAIDAALANLKTGRTLYILDFWDQADMPRLFARGLKRWLAMFHVHFRPELLEDLHRRDEAGEISLTVEPLMRRYAYTAVVTKL